MQTPNDSQQDNSADGAVSDHPVTQPADATLRRCIATGETHPKDALMRCVLGPDGALVPDIVGKLPGRGIWITPTRAAFATAIKRDAFTRAAKAKTNIPNDLAGMVDGLLAKRVLELISLARKSGQAVAGFEKVKDWLLKEKADTLIQACDGSGRGKSKLSTPYQGHFIGWLTAGELGLAFGRQSVIHTALTPGGLTDRIVMEAHRLKGMRELAVKPTARKEKRA